MSYLDYLDSKAAPTLEKLWRKEARLTSTLADVLRPHNNGGLYAVEKSFEQSGLGDYTASWIGKGPNKDISTVQIEQALGADRIKEIADKAETTPQAVRTKLPEILPPLVDQLTPGGRIPPKSLLEKGLHYLQLKLGHLKT
jgi:uncharacterized protein YidB (DUF937 family)